MINHIEEKIKEGKLRLVRKMESHDCSTSTISNAIVIMEETIISLLSTQKDEIVEKLKGIKKIQYGEAARWQLLEAIGEEEGNKRLDETISFNYALDEVIKTIQASDAQ